MNTPFNYYSMIVSSCVKKLLALAVITILTIGTTCSSFANTEKVGENKNEAPTLSVNANGEQTYTTSLTDSEIEQALDEQMQKEIDAIIAEGEANGISLFASTAGRPTYTTTHGDTEIVTAPKKKVSGQPAGGVQFSNGGSVYVDWSGGTSFSFSYSFPTPYGSIGLSATPGKKVTQATGVAVKIPASKTKHYVVYLANRYKCRPYIVYEVSNGKKSVYYKGSSKVWYQSDFSLKTI